MCRMLQVVAMLAVLVLLSSYRISGQHVVVPPANRTLLPYSPAENSTGVEIIHMKSTTSSISVQLLSTYKVHSWYVDYWQTGSSQVSRTLQLNSSVQECSIVDLVSNQNYEVCAYVEGYKSKKMDKLEELSVCATLYTIPLIRWDSLLALIIVIGYLALMVIIGIISWYIAKTKIEAAAAAASSPAEVQDQDEPMDVKKELLMPLSAQNRKGQPRPKSFMEDDTEIPYIEEIEPVDL